VRRDHDARSDVVQRGHAIARAMSEFHVARRTEAAHTSVCIGARHRDASAMRMRGVSRREKTIGRL
jgi:hypothetical protein